MLHRLIPSIPESHPSPPSDSPDLSPNAPQGHSNSTFLMCLIIVMLVCLGKCDMIQFNVQVNNAGGSSSAHVPNITPVELQQHQHQQHQQQQPQPQQRSGLTDTVPIGFVPPPPIAPPTAIFNAISSKLINDISNPAQGIDKQQKVAFRRMMKEIVRENVESVGAVRTVGEEVSGLVERGGGMRAGWGFVEPKLDRLPSGYAV